MESGGIRLNDECTDASMASGAVYTGKNDGEVSAEAVGYPDFLAIQDVIIALFPGCSLYTRYVRTNFWFGQSVAADPITCGKQREIAALLYLGAPIADAEGNKACMNGQETTHGRIGPSEFLAEQGVAHVVHARSTILRFDWPCQEAQFAHTLDQVQGEFAFLIRYSCYRRYFLLCELACLNLDVFLLGGQFEIHKRFPLTICVQHCETFNLDQRLLLEKARDLERGCRRVIIAKERAMHLAKWFKVREIIIAVAHKDINFRDILHLPASSFDNHLEIAKYLFILGYQVTGRSYLTFSIAACLPGKEEEAATCYKDTMTEAPGTCQG